MHNHIDGRLWISKAKQNFLGKGRIELLEQIHHTGSISGAAKTMKMSYKAAWDTIDAINTLSEEPLVTRSTGGKGGGGTKLTPKGLEYITLYKEIEQAQNIFFEALEHYTDDPKKLSAFISKLTLRTSARNQILGTVNEIRLDDSQANVILSVEPGIDVVVTITLQSLREMNIQKGNAIYILLKASWVSLYSTKPDKVETQNILEGTILEVNEEALRSEVTVAVGKTHKLVVSVPTKELFDKKLTVGQNIWALFDTSSALLAV
ncbi:MAG: TOBE domain-containing protein [Campylobacterales bacterium]|nr:TOBE domain-containing protein [Campylobacterales bacterium]